MNAINTSAALCCLAWLASCSIGSKPSARGNDATDSLTTRLNQKYGYQMDKQGNWVPTNDKRSQFESQGDNGFFRGNVDKKPYRTGELSRTPWLGGKEIDRPGYRNGSKTSPLAKGSTYNGRTSTFDGNLRTPTRITGNHRSKSTAIEQDGTRLARPSDAETDFRRKVFGQPDVVDYRQQRELSIEESKQILGR